MKQNFVIRSNGAYEMGKNFKNKEQNLKIKSQIKNKDVKIKKN